MLNFNVKVNAGVDLKSMEKTIKLGQFALDQQVAKDSNFFVPKDTSALEGSVISSSNFGSGVISWSTPYARRLYYGTNFKFSKDKNPNASALWFERAKAMRKRKWVEIAKQTIADNL